MTPKKIIRAVSEVTGIHSSLILGDYRTPKVVQARYLVIGILREAQPTWSNLELGLAVGREAHGTALHALKKCMQLSSNPEFIAQWRAVVRILCAPPATV